MRYLAPMLGLLTLPPPPRSSQLRILDTRTGPDYALFTAGGIDLERTALAA